MGVKKMKDLKISKELLIEVLGSEYNQRLVDWFQIEEDNFLRTYYDCGSYDDKGRPMGLGLEINIYEFAFKCKEWIINKEYHINTSENRINNYIYLYKMIKSDFGYEIDKSNGVQFDSKGYINNLFEACEWILEQNK